jgi:Flp pilus assembly pilin Flp
MRERFKTFLGDDLGASAAEFALVLPLLSMLVFGTIQLTMAMYAASTLRASVEEAARCASAKQYTTCGDSNGIVSSTKVVAVATGFYSGPGIGPSFVYATDASCGSPSDSTKPGHRVTGTGSYAMGVGLASFTIPLSATACFPSSQP